MMPSGSMLNNNISSREALTGEEYRRVSLEVHPNSPFIWCDKSDFDNFFTATEFDEDIFESILEEYSNPSDMTNEYSNSSTNTETYMAEVTNTSDVSEPVDDKNLDVDILPSDEPYSYLQGLNSDNLMQFSQITNDNNVAAPVAGQLHSGAIKDMLKSGNYKITLKRGHSKVWNTFGKILNEEGIEIKGVVGCRFCFGVYKNDTRSTSNLNKHKCYIDSQNTAEKFNIPDAMRKEAAIVFTEWVIQNCRPFVIVKDEGFKNVTQFLINIGEKYGSNVNIDTLIPQNTTVSRNIFKLYEIHFERIKNIVTAAKSIGFGLTTDLWSDNFLRKTYLGVTLHCIIEGKLFNVVLGLKSMNGEKCTGVNILLKMQNLISEFNCQLDDNCTVVTDRGANMVAAFRDYRHLYCINHLLDNVLQKTVKDVGVVADLYKSCSKLVSYFKKSGLNSQLSACLQSFSPTRWNTVHYMFASVHKCWEEVLNILRQNRELKRVDGIDYNYLQAIATVLEPFEKASKMLEGQEYPTVHYVLIYIQQLRKKCDISELDLNIVKELKTKLLENIESTVLPNISLIHRVALFLFPPANKLTQFTDTEKICTKRECRRIMENLSHSTQNDAVEPNILSAENLDLLSDFLQESRAENINETIDQEISKYENTHISMTNDFDILKWWESRKTEFPILYRVSGKILCVPASSAPSERIFSAGRQALTEARSTIGKNAEKVNELIFLHTNINQKNLNEELKNIED